MGRHPDVTFGHDEFWHRRGRLRECRRGAPLLPSSVRELARVLQRKATIAEIAARAKLSADDVRPTLTLLKVIQR